MTQMSEHMSKLATPPEAAGGVIWLVGLSASGKTTLAHALVEALGTKRLPIILDGDLLRAGLCSDLGFSLKDRAENMRRTREVAALLASAGHWVIVALISPLATERALTRTRLSQAAPFLEVFVDCPLEVCIARDPKGLYARALAGELEHFTGLSSPFEPPAHPDVRVQSAAVSPEQCAALVMDELVRRGW